MAEPNREEFGVFYAPPSRRCGGFSRACCATQPTPRICAHDAYQRVYSAMERQRIEKPRAFLYTTARRLALKDQAPPNRAGA